MRLCMSAWARANVSTLKFVHACHGCMRVSMCACARAIVRICAQICVRVTCVQCVCAFTFVRASMYEFVRELLFACEWCLCVCVPYVHARVHHVCARKSAHFWPNVCHAMRACACACAHVCVQIRTFVREFEFTCKFVQHAMCA